MSLIPPIIKTSKPLSVLSDLASQEIDGLRRLSAGVLRVTDVDQVPVEWLPYLAWQYRADGYRDELPETTKRKVVKSALLVHRYRGTRFAVEEALAALGCQADITEWWEPEGNEMPSHTFRIQAWANENIGNTNEPFLTPGLFVRVNEVVQAAKPVRAQFELQVGVRMQSQMGVSSAISGLSVGRFSAVAEPIKPRPLLSTLGIVSSLCGLSVGRFSLKAVM